MAQKRNLEVAAAIDLYIEAVARTNVNEPITTSDILAWTSQHFDLSLSDSTVLNHLKSRCSQGELVMKTARDVHYEFYFYMRGVNDGTEN